ncbi:gamma carbonic anhydrase family protein [Croceibacterium aestuarii]|uniref:gamma carbonic anhydrase family protein n=1 Tax=Croceibacterium aestuarii TaxID=3064139 RepID=UPI00272E0B9F|nr:gamma carbonic anhydrase family protein [Croceibacterium sp. D39]
MSGRLTILPFDGKTPRIHASAFVAPGARIIGDVEIGPEASIWYNCVLRGDINSIVIGARSNLQDGTIVHVEGPRPGAEGLPTVIGDDVLVGHMAILHGCVVEDRAFVGMGAIVMDASRLGSGAMLAAGAMLTPGKAIPAAQLWAGRPAVFRRELRHEELAGMAKQTQHYVDNARRHRASLIEAGLEQ